MNNHHYPAETPDDLDLYEHDALEGRIPPSARGGRKSSRILEVDDDGGFDGDGRIRKGASRRDAEDNPRRRPARVRGESEFDAPPPLRQGPPPYSQNRGAPPRPYSPGGARTPDSPRGYGERSGQDDTRPINRPPYGDRTGDNRGPGFRPARPMNAARPYRPPMRRDEGQDTRSARPVPPRIPPGEARPAAQQLPRFQPHEPRRAYGPDSDRRAGPSTPPPGGNGGSRGADSSPRRPDPRYDRPRQFRRDEPNRDAGRS